MALGNIVGRSLYLGGTYLNGDPENGSIDVGNTAKSLATPYIDLNGFGTSKNNVRMINDANGQLTINGSWWEPASQFKWGLT